MKYAYLTFVLCAAVTFGLYADARLPPEDHLAGVGNMVARDTRHATVLSAPLPPPEVRVREVVKVVRVEVGGDRAALETAIESRKQGVLAGDRTTVVGNAQAGQSDAVSTHEKQGKALSSTVKTTPPQKPIPNHPPRVPLRSLLSALTPPAPYTLPRPSELLVAMMLAGPLTGPAQLSAVAGPQLDQPNQSPAADVEQAYADSQRLPLSIQPHVRYLTLADLPGELRQPARIAVNKALQDLSRVRQITPAVPVGEFLLRINARDYCPTDAATEQWELAFGTVAATDSRYNIQTLVLFPGEATPRQTTVTGGWTGLATMGQLRALTYTPTNGPIMRASWFVAHALVAPVYYDFIGAGKTQAEFLAGMGVDEKTISKLETDIGANIRKSGVTRKQRRLIEENGAIGSVWITLDSAIETASSDIFRYPLSVGTAKVEYLAAELFVMGLNGHWKVAVFNEAGVRQNFVDQRIATDDRAENDGADDKTIYIGNACLLCHTQNGLNSFSDSQQKLYHTQHGRVAIKAYGDSLIRRQLEFYDDDRLQQQAEYDRSIHALAVQRGCGCDPAHALAATAEVVKHVSYDSVSPDLALYEIGVNCNPERWKAKGWTRAHWMKLALSKIVNGTHDQQLAALCEGDSIGRAQWEVSSSEVYTKAARFNFGN